MNRRNFFGALTVAASTLALASAALAEDYTFRLHHMLGQQAPAQTKMLEPWAKAVEENSGGRVKIEIFPSMTLGGRPPELVQQARDGIVDLIWTVNGYTPGLFPRTEVMELPTVYRNDPKAANLALYDMFEDDLAQDYAGLEVMFLHVHAGQGLQTADLDVTSLDDLAGAKLRIPTRTGAWVIEALGATPVAMPVPELPPALQKGVVAGALIPWEIIPPLKIQDQTKYQIEMYERERFGNTTFQVSMNQARWDGLPEDIQQAFRDASGRDWWGQVGDIWRASDDFGIKFATDAGNTHRILSEAETQPFLDAMEPVVDRWIEEVTGGDIDGAALVEKARALVTENTAD
ncbi:TRAP transporter substrate-binding protein [Sagittula sp. NFXS13]|uniref:TRAP-type C4-dicarboxylate transport system substrate-binding protein n=1 Tax=Sagittula marina TaxID=943940 RepID=A0A7W6DR97_9RHOB|nr:TRAP transporter substrate-binding protein [Sagittula marina]MBB3987502.1 TRAP-type C4-dicarboxylate transport system substrate-binding protein [Sagittula marina]